MFDRRLLTHFDWFLLIIVCLIALIGIVNLFSTTADWSIAATAVYLKQLSWLGIGLLIAFVVCSFDYRHLEYLAFPLYGLTVLLLGLVLVVGRTSMGATRWIHIGFFNLQPSELMKIVIIMTLACYFTRREQPPPGYSLRELGMPFRSDEGKGKGLAALKS